MIDTASLYTSGLFSTLGASGGTNDLLATAYGRNNTQAPSGGNPVLAMQQAVSNQTKAVAAKAKEPEIKRDVDAFRAAVAAAPDVQTLLANPVARKVLLTANGLGDQVDSKALAQRALMSDLSKTDSLANRLTDKRWATMAKTYDFAKQGLTVLKDPAVLTRLADGYAEIAWRKSLDQTTPGLSKAISFRDQAAKVTSATQILGDPVLREVVTTALNIPKQIAFQPLDTQERAITSRLDVSRLKDPKFVEQFTRRYLIAAGAAASDGTQPTGIASLFA